MMFAENTDFEGSPVGVRGGELLTRCAPMP